jgi:hypothetical protein
LLIITPLVDVLRSLPPSRLHVQDSRLDSYNTTVNVLQSEESRSDAAAIQSSPCSNVSSTTFNTFRANSGQSLSSKSSQDEVGEKVRPRRQPSLNTLLSPPSRATEELVCLFGDMDGKLRPGATFQLRDQDCISCLKVVDLPISSQKPVNATTLERAKPRPRVKLNLQLAGDTIVQGQGISGHLVVHVRDHSRAELPVLLANNKLRVIGFEYLTDGPTFHVFFHYSCPFEEVSYASEQIFSESPDYTDEEGYREARKGLHVLPFEMILPVDTCFGKPKGAVEVSGGAAVRYIIMAYVLRVSSGPMLIVCCSSVHIKDSKTDRLSLAHFYRSCTIWPSLSLQEVLVPSTRALVSTAVMSLPHRGSCSKLKLSARVPRPSYFSGQLCYVNIQISNETRKIVRSLRLTLIRTTTVYRPRSGSRSRGEYSMGGHASSSYQAKAFVDEISESTLVMSERTTRRCVSSRGWWAGVHPQEKTALTHRILIPVRPYPDTLSARGLAHLERSPSQPDALSIARSEFLAVDHAIRVTAYASAGALGLSSRLSVTLPIRIVSMLSVDPPISVSRPPDIPVPTYTNGPSAANVLGHHQYNGSVYGPDSPPPYRTRLPSLEHSQGTTVSEGDHQKHLLYELDQIPSSAYL